MAGRRQEILDWVISGRLRPEDVPRALEIAGVTPRPGEWHNFLSNLTLWLGTALAGAGVIFFLAFNWQQLPRMGKFAAVELLLTAAFVTAAVAGLRRLTGRVAIHAAALLTGAPLALFGQTYQNGADSAALFAYWALLIVPWVLAARSESLWILWLCLSNLAIVTYFQTHPWGIAGVAFSAPAMQWTLLAVDAAALAAWEWAAGGAWGARALGAVTGALVTILALQAAHESEGVGAGAVLLYFVWAGGTWYLYSRRRFDVFLLSGLVLSGIVLFLGTVGYHAVRRLEVGEILATGVGVIGMSAAGSWWIRGLLRERGQ